MSYQFRGAPGGSSRGIRVAGGGSRLDNMTGIAVSCFIRPFRHVPRSETGTDICDNDSTIPLAFPEFGGIFSKGGYSLGCREPAGPQQGIWVAQQTESDGTSTFQRTQNMITFRADFNGGLISSDGQLRANWIWGTADNAWHHLFFYWTGGNALPVLWKDNVQLSYSNLTSSYRRSGPSVGAPIVLFTNSCDGNGDINNATQLAATSLNTKTEVIVCGTDTNTSTFVCGRDGISNRINDQFDEFRVGASHDQTITEFDLHPNAGVATRYNEISHFALWKDLSIGDIGFDSRRLLGLHVGRIAQQIKPDNLVLYLHSLDGPDGHILSDATGGTSPANGKLVDESSTQAIVTVDAINNARPRSRGHPFGVQ